MDAVIALQQVIDDPTAGRDLDETGELLVLESAAQEPEEPSVTGVVAVDSRDWREIAKLCDGLLKESKDLRVAVLRSRAQLKTKGLAAFCDAINFIRELIGRFWTELYPRLDEDDDPTGRINVVRELCNAHMLAELRGAEVAAVRGIGSFTLHDILVTKGITKPRPGVEAPAPQHVAQVLRDGCPPALRAQVHGAIESLLGIESEIRGQVGNAYACDLGPIRDLLTRIRDAIDENAPMAPETMPDGSGNNSAGPHGGNSSAPNYGSNEISSREDFLRMLDKALAYYARHEPSSPVPLLLERAKRLASMTFVDIIKDMADVGLPQIEVISGQKFTTE